MNERMNEIFSMSDNDKGFGREAKLGKALVNAGREKTSVKSEGAGKVTLGRWHVNKQNEVREWYGHWWEGGLCGQDAVSGRQMAGAADRGHHGGLGHAFFMTERSLQSLCLC